MQHALETRLFDAAIPAVYRLARRPQFRLLQELRERDHWSRDQLEAHQLQHLRALVEHAARTVPYYRDLFRDIGVRPEDIRTLADYARIPVLTKQLIRENLDRLCSDAATDLLPNVTGGSTGMPMRFFQSREFLDLGSAAWFRNYLWTGLPLGCRKFYVWGHPSETRLAHQLKGRFEHWLHRRLFFDAFDVSSDHVRTWIAAIIEYGARFGYGYASALAAVAELARGTGLEVHGIDAVMSTAERLYPHQRQVIEDVFGCRVFDQYGSREIWSIASECRNRRIHINADLHLVEHVDRGEPQPNLVITPLFNRAMPLLRYVNDDLAAPVHGACACGMSYPTMTSVQGRASDNFKTPDGRIVHGEYLTHLMYGVDGVEAFQFVQRAVCDVRLSIVKSARFDARTSEKLSAVAAEFERYFGFPLAIDVVPTIERAASGKLRFTVSHV